MSPAKFTKIVIFSLLPIILLLLCGEIFARIRLYTKNKDIFYLVGPFFENRQKFEKQVNYEFNIDNRYKDSPKTYFKLKPGSYAPPERYSYGKFYINSLGFRNKEFNAYDKNGKIRIFCLGESSTFGAESPDDKTWPVKLEYYLNKKGKGNKIEVINAGFAAYQSLLYSNLMRLELINYKPDIFIVYAGINELNRNDVKKDIGKIMNDLHNYLYYRSMLYTLLIEKISVAVQNSPVPMNVWTVKANENYIANCKKMIQACKEHNVKLIFVRQMLHAQKELFTEDSLTLDKVKAIQNGLPQQDKYNKAYTPPLEFYRHYVLMDLLKKLCAENNVEYVDLRKSLNKSLDSVDIFNDDVHLTAEGNDLLAKLISENISP